MKIPVRLIAMIAITLLTIGFLVMLWKGCQHETPKSKLETATENVIQARIKSQIAHDTFLVRDATYQKIQKDFDSLAARVYRGDPSLDAQRDSLRAVIERAVADTVRVRAARQRAPIPKTQTPPSYP